MRAEELDNDGKASSETLPQPVEGMNSKRCRNRPASTRSDNACAPRARAWSEPQRSRAAPETAAPPDRAARGRRLRRHRSGRLPARLSLELCAPRRHADRGRRDRRVCATHARRRWWRPADLAFALSLRSLFGERDVPHPDGADRRAGCLARDARRTRTESRAHDAARQSDVDPGAADQPAAGDRRRFRRHAARSRRPTPRTAARPIHRPPSRRPSRRSRNRCPSSHRWRRSRRNRRRLRAAQETPVAHRAERRALDGAEAQPRRAGSRSSRTDGSKLEYGILPAGAERTYQQRQARCPCASAMPKAPKSASMARPSTSRRSGTRMSRGCACSAQTAPRRRRGVLTRP